MAFAGLAKVEAAARTTRLVSDQRLKWAVVVSLTESQECGEDTDELHCRCCYMWMIWLWETK